MEQLIMPKGTLRRLAHQKNLLTDLTIFAESEQEEFSEVQVITLNQYVKELALERALGDMPVRHTSKDVSDRVKFLVETEYTSAREFVSIEKNAIIIGVSKSEIDDAVIDYALSLLIQIESFEAGQRFEFGKIMDCR